VLVKINFKILMIFFNGLVSYACEYV